MNDNDNDTNADETVSFDGSIKVAAELHQLEVRTLSSTDDVKQEWERRASLFKLAEMFKRLAKGAESAPEGRDTLIRLQMWIEEQPWGQPGWLTAERESELREWESELIRIGVIDTQENITPPAKKEPLRRAQERVILETLVELGYDPQALPARKGNAPGAKSAVWKVLTSRGQLFGNRDIFDSAWERLRADDEILGGK